MVIVVPVWTGREARVLRMPVLAFVAPGDRAFQRRFPHQMSGGQRQRVALARAPAAEPRVLILDEPTSGLDVVTQDLVLDEIARQRDRLGLALVVISHDLAVVACLADRLLVLRHGRVVEEGGLLTALSTPAHPYTAALVAASGDVSQALRRRAGSPTGDRRVIDVTGLTAGYGRGHRRLVACHDVSFPVHEGECVALVGASGTGKSTLARCLVGLHGPDDGTVTVAGELVP
ncbi:MAG: ATP-binding cassette domain-containing protein [Egibacteraceae bacterium]